MAAQEIKPYLLDIVKRDADYALYYDGAPLLTPAGHEVAHPDLRILEHINRELCVSGQYDESDISAYMLFAAQERFVRGDIVALTSAWDVALGPDPMARGKFDPAGAAVGNLDAFLDVLGEQQQQLGFFFGGITGTTKSFNEFLIHYTEGQVSIADITRDGLLHIMRRVYEQLKQPQQAVVSVLRHVHQAGVILPMLLALNRITPSEYANTLFSVHLPVTEDDGAGPEAVDPFALSGARVFLPDWKNPEASFLTLRDHAARAVEFLSCFEYAADVGATVQDLIRTGESFTVEFKSTLRWHIRAGRKDPAIEHAALKTLSAFLNSSGGILFLGVNDNGDALGLEIDQFENEDKFALHFWNLVKASMGQDVSPFIHATFEPYQDKRIFVVQCARSPRPVFLNQKGFDEEFYIRIGPGSAKLTIAEALKYIAARFAER